MIFAHRGLCQRAPENTLAAFRLAHEAGCRWIELDVDILADGTPVILHDSTLDCTTNRSGSMYRITRDDLKEIDADVNVIVIQEHRDLSNEVAERINHRHQSPQAFVIKDGKAIYHATHYGINPAEIESKLRN